MKNSVFILFTVLISFKMKAQEADLVTHHAINDSLVSLFNKQAFDASYNLLSPTMQGQLPKEQVKTYITDPLSMADTKINIAPNDSVRFAKPYDEAGNPSSYWDITGLGAAGAIRSTVSDMLKYVKANMDVSTPALALTQKPTFKDRPDNEIGLFCQLSTTKKGQLLTWHNGGTGGFMTFCGFIKAQNIAVVMLNNSGNDVTQKGVDLLKALGQ